MPLKTHLALGLAALLCGFAASASAQPVTIRAEGQLEHLYTAWLAPAVVRSCPYASVSITLDRSETPLSSDERTATYPALSATLSLNGVTFPLSNAVLIVERFTLGPLPAGYSYMIRGVTPGGWLFSLRAGSSSPDFAPDFDIPTAMPPGDLDYAHDLTLRDEFAGWDAFGDGGITAVTHADEGTPSSRS